MTIDINELRQLAQAATPGPDGISLSWVRLLRDFQQGASPAAITEILDRLEAAEKERDALRAALQHEADCVEAAKAEIDVLRAKIAEMEQQEPVRHEFQGRDGVWYPFIGQRHYENTVADGTWPIRALYALPGAQGEEK